MIKDSSRDSLTWSPRRESCCDEVPGMLTNAVMSLSCVDMGSPRDDEKCLSMTYSVHQRLRHRMTMSTPSSSSGSCVCSPSNCAMRIA